MKREDVMPNELSMDVQLSTIAAMCRKLAAMDVDEMPGLDELTSKEKFILVENRTVVQLREIAVSLMQHVEFRRKYS
jgi:hypothetical protein